MVPIWLKNYLRNEDLLLIEKAIAEAESKTTGEIVPMIVHRSSAIKSLPVYLFIFLFMAYNLFIDLIYQNNVFSSIVLMISVYIIGVILLVPISYYLSFLHRIQRLLIHPLDRDQQSYQRAKNEFYNLNLNKTDGSTGILIFVSIMDREVVILADRAINDKINSQFWDEIKNQMIHQLRNKNMCQGFLDAIKSCEDILKIYFPIILNDKNELPNKIIIKE